MQRKSEKLRYKHNFLEEVSNPLSDALLCRTIAGSPLLCKLDDVMDAFLSAEEKEAIAVLQRKEDVCGPGSLFSYANRVTLVTPDYNIVIHRTANGLGHDPMRVNNKPEFLIPTHCLPEAMAKELNEWADTRFKLKTEQLDVVHHVEAISERLSTYGQLLSLLPELKMVKLEGLAYSAAKHMKTKSSLKALDLDAYMFQPEIMQKLREHITQAGFISQSQLSVEAVFGLPEATAWIDSRKHIMWVSYFSEPELNRTYQLTY